MSRKLEEYVVTIPDFPEPGIMFRDITSVIQDPDGLKLAIDGLVDLLKGVDFDLVVGPESRGFIFGVPVAYELGKGFVPARKPGKLPCETVKMEYALEYGTAEIEVHKADIKAGEKILVIDDLIATGGTLKAARNVIEQGGASVAEFFGIVGLPELNYMDVLAPTPVKTLIDFAGA